MKRIRFVCCGPAGVVLAAGWPELAGAGVVCACGASGSSESDETGLDETGLDETGLDGTGPTAGGVDGVSDMGDAVRDTAQTAGPERQRRQTNSAVRGRRRIAE
jgi:hypothetical protein